MKNCENKKSQAAIEFLITYGWAILGVMVVVGALAYFGVFNTDRFINDECSFGTQLYCEDFLLGSNGKLQTTFRNNFGQDIIVTDMLVYYDSVDMAFDDSGFLPENIPNGGVITIGGDLSSTFPTNDKIKLSVLVKYQRSVLAPIHNVTGTIVATAQ